ncbi:hypothetical protein [Salipaludibacillus daqingensis]|uniref:hypothetical protein n=1 Tax=Salipaludibacillus daqingensis TaxID=3041001 RepID=UPI002473ED3A|nr:hypothetical protein [Salipaludibacillus daqingensis]
MSEFKENGVSVKISKQMIYQILQDNIQDENITITSVDFKDDLVVVYGIVKKVRMSINVSITLIPEGGQNKKMFFRINKVDPIHSKRINKKLFKDKSPYVSYRDEVISIDLNQIEKVKNIPVGNIKSMEITDGMLVVKIGL